MNKEEKSAYNRAYLIANQEAIQKRKAAFRAVHKARLAAEMAAYRKANPEHCKARTKAHFAANKDKINRQNRENRYANAERTKMVRIAWRAENVEALKRTNLAYRASARGKLTAEAAAKRAYLTHKDKFIAWTKENRARHPEKMRALKLAKTREYQAREKRAMPAWADHKAIKRVYIESAKVTAETGVPHNVDHIVPLTGRTVCGIHVHYNLRIIPARENQSKRSKLIPELAVAPCQSIQRSTSLPLL